MNVQRSRQRAGAGRHDQGVQRDLPQHHAERVQQRRMVAVGQLDQERNDREQKDAVAAEDQGRRRRRLGAEHGEREARAHIADIAVSAGEARERRLAQRQRTDEPPYSHGDDERDHGRKRGRDQEWRVVQFRERRFRHDPEQQRRQRHVEQEEIHPGEAGFRQSLGVRLGVTLGWVPVRVKKTRQNKMLEPPFRFNRNGGSSIGGETGPFDEA